MRHLEPARPRPDDRPAEGALSPRRSGVTGRRRVGLLATALALVAAVGSGPALGAGGHGHADHAGRADGYAPGRALVRASDDGGDVTVYATPGASGAQRASIDIERLSLVPAGGVVRVKVGLRDVLRHAPFDQVAYVSIKPDPSSRQHWTFDLGMTAQQRGAAYANFVADGRGVRGGDRYCGGLRTGVARRSATLTVAVPRRCLPPFPGSLQLTTLTGPYRADGATYSLDTLQVPVVPALR